MVCKTPYEEAPSELSYIDCWSRYEAIRGRNSSAVHAVVVNMKARERECVPERERNTFM